VSKNHAGHLVPAFKTPCAIIAIVLFHDTLEFVSRKQVQELRKDVLPTRQYQIKDQKMLLSPSQTEKGAFSVVAEISAKNNPPAGPFGLEETHGRIEGEIRNGVFKGEIDRRLIISTEGQRNSTGEMKGTFSNNRASGTLKESVASGMDIYGTWTAEKIS
jgi:hypothetical protein